MKHFFIDGTFYVPKNKAHEEASDYAGHYNHVVMDEIKVKELVDNFRQKVAEINAKHKRCHDIVVSYNHFDVSGFESMHLGIEGTCSLRLVLVKRFEDSANSGRVPIGDMKEH